MAIITVEKKKLKELPFNRIAPNIVTLGAMSAGITSIRFAIAGRWEAAVLAIIVAAILDGLDGRVARFLNGATKFGAELDSLSDFVSFGVAPAFLLYLWSMQDVKGIGWFLALFYALCCGIRLARFNTMLDQDPPPYWKNFFTGLPAPGGAFTVIVPLVLHFYTEEDFFRSPWVVGSFLAVCGFLMASFIPTISLKKLKINVNLIGPSMMLAALLFAAIITAPWLALGLAGLLYLVTIPFFVLLFRKYKKAYEAQRKDGE